MFGFVASFVRIFLFQENIFHFHKNKGYQIITSETLRLLSYDFHG